MVELNRKYLVKKYGKDNLINRTEIVIWNSQIKKIDFNAFQGLTKLESLSLSYNAIEEIDERSFEGLSNLKELWLDNNKLRRIDSNTFKGLTKLETLYLVDNEIEEIDERSFGSLSNLIWLSLYNNKLKEIDRKCFEPLKSIEAIAIYQNNDLNAVSFIKPSNKYWYDKEKLKKFGSVSEWNEFLKQFPEQSN